MLTNKGKYGLKAMTHLAGMPQGQPALVADNVALFIARNQARILPVYYAWTSGAGRASFCWPGFLLPQAWFLYRKMYLWAALVSAGPLLFAYVPRLAWLNWSTSLIGAIG